MNYPDIEALSNTGMNYLSRSPAHYRAWKDGLLSNDSTPALEFGIAFHKAILEPEDFSKKYMCLADNTGLSPGQKSAATKAAKKYVPPDKIALPYLEYNRIIKMREAVIENPFAASLLMDEATTTEEVVVWQKNSCLCKGRLDVINRKEKIIVDIKTTDDASEATFKSSVWRYKLYRQASFYLEPFEGFTFVWIAVEKSRPHGVAIYECHQDFLIKGTEEIERMRKIYSECCRTNHWPGYSEQITSLSPSRKSEADTEANPFL